MANAEQLKTSMSGMKDRITADSSKLHDFLDALLQSADSSVRDLATKAKEAATNISTHFDAFVQTAMVAADSPPARGAAVQPVAPGRGAPRSTQQYAPVPTKMSGVPATPPGGPSTTLGPAITHDDVGHIDPATGRAREVPAAVGAETHKIGENGTEGEVSTGEASSLSGTHGDGAK